MFEEDTIDKEYDKAIQNIMNNTNLHNDILLMLYGLYKQITVGDNIENPNFKTLKDKRKWESWEFYKGCTSKYCKLELIDISTNLN
jgi:acyl-CoA-binding protein